MSEDRSVLCRKYLKLVDLFQTGMTYELPNYIIQICEPQNLQGDDLGKSNMPKGIADSTLDVLRIPLKRKNNGNKLLCNEELKKSLAVEFKGTGSSQVSRTPSTMGVPRDNSRRDVLQIISQLRKSEESPGSKMSKEQLEASNPPIPDVQEGEVNRVGIMTPHVNCCVTFSGLGHILNPQDCNKVANIHDSIMDSKAPSKGNKSNCSPNSVSPSSGLMPLIPKLDKGPDVADSIQKPSMVESNLKISTCDGSFGMSIAMHANNVACSSFFSETEKEKLCCMSSAETNDERASCSNLEIANSAKDECSNQLAEANTNNMEGIGTLPVTDMSANVQSIPSCTLASLLTSELSESSSMPKMIDRTCDIPSFDLGF